MFDAQRLQLKDLALGGRMILLAVDEAQLSAYVTTDRVKRSDGYSVDAGIATIAVDGPLSHCDELMAYFEGGTSYGQIRRLLDQANGDASVKAILLRFGMSPGGHVAGLHETAAAIRASAKPVGAYVDGYAYSAAYGLAAAAHLVHASPGAKVGSVGVVLRALDTTKLEEMLGVKTITVTSANAPEKYTDPATDAGRAAMQAIVDDSERVFVEQIAAHRDVKARQVTSDFGRGRLVQAADAKRAGMIDAVGGEDALRTKLLSRRVGGGGARAMDENTEKLRADLAAAKEDAAQLLGALGARDVPAGLGVVAALKACKADLDVANAQLAEVGRQTEARAQADRDAGARNLIACALADGRIREQHRPYVASIVQLAGGTLAWDPLAVTGATDALQRQLEAYAATLPPLVGGPPATEQSPGSRDDVAALADKLGGQIKPEYLAKAAANQAARAGRKVV